MKGKSWGRLVPSGPGGELRAQKGKMPDPVPIQSVAIFCAWGSLAVTRGRNSQEKSVALDVTFTVHPHPTPAAAPYQAVCKRVLLGNSEAGDQQLLWMK